MEVYFNKKSMKDGEFLKVSESQIEPKIKLNVNLNNFYTLILYDPDAVSGTYIHWVIINITSNDIKTGNIIIPYKGPTPPPKSGKHRYIFGLYKQNRENNVKPINERVIEINKLKEMLKLNSIIFEIKFISENEIGGRKTKRKRNKKFKRTRRH